MKTMGDLVAKVMQEHQVEMTLDEIVHLTESGMNGLPWYKRLVFKLIGRYW